MRGSTVLGPNLRPGRQSRSLSSFPLSRCFPAPCYHHLAPVFTCGLLRAPNPDNRQFCEVFCARREHVGGRHYSRAFYSLPLARALALPGPAVADSAGLLSVITRIGLSYLGFVCAARHKTRGRVVAQKIDVSTFTELPVTSLCRLWTPLHTGAGGGKHVLYHEQNIPTFPWIIIGTIHRLKR